MKCPIHEKALTWYLCTDEIRFSTHFNACLAEKVPYMSHKEKNSDDSVKIVKFMEKNSAWGWRKIPSQPLKIERAAASIYVALELP